MGSDRTAEAAFASGSFAFRTNLGGIPVIYLQVNIKHMAAFGAAEFIYCHAYISPEAFIQNILEKEYRLVKCF